jgi:hypothetical protein
MSIQIYFTLLFALNESLNYSKNNICQNDTVDGTVPDHSLMVIYSVSKINDLKIG